VRKTTIRQKERRKQANKQTNNKSFRKFQNV